MELRACLFLAELAKVGSDLPLLHRESSRLGPLAVGHTGNQGAGVLGFPLRRLLEALGFPRGQPSHRRREVDDVKSEGGSAVPYVGGLRDQVRVGTGHLFEPVLLDSPLHSFDNGRGRVSSTVPCGPAVVLEGAGRDPFPADPL